MSEQGNDHFWPLGSRVASINGDDFVGTVIGHYTRLDKRLGVVVQQDGTRVVHVYGNSRVEANRAFLPSQEQEG